ncbi:MAG: hypothetical protein LHV69_04825 [Elusimicrobia bacterium]|nr:hypothetical protein [Candidatus Obscuribacterium magneticum]
MTNLPRNDTAARNDILRVLLAGPKPERIWVEDLGEPAYVQRRAQELSGLGLNVFEVNTEGEMVEAADRLRSWQEGGVDPATQVFVLLVKTADFGKRLEELTHQMALITLIIPQGRAMSRRVNGAISLGGAMGEVFKSGNPLLRPFAESLLRQDLTVRLFASSERWDASGQVYLRHQSVPLESLPIRVYLSRFLTELLGGLREAQSISDFFDQLRRERRAIHQAA